MKYFLGIKIGTMVKCLGGICIRKRPAILKIGKEFHSLNVTYQLLKANFTIRCP